MIPALHPAASAPIVFQLSLLVTEDFMIKFLRQIA
jgi:hypothetical protein